MALALAEMVQLGYIIYMSLLNLLYPDLRHHSVIGGIYIKLFVIRIFFTVSYGVTFIVSKKVFTIPRESYSITKILYPPPPALS